MLEATYYTPLLAHASMEPPAAVADFQRRQGRRCGRRRRIRRPSQDTVAAALGIDKKDVICHVTLLGGGFGRKSKPDFARKRRCCRRSSASPSRSSGRAKTTSRFDYYHATAAVYHKAAVDGRGKPTAWLQRSAFPPIASTFDRTRADAARASSSIWG